MTNNETRNKNFCSQPFCNRTSPMPESLNHRSLVLHSVLTALLVLMLWVQQEHVIEHTFDHDDDVCIICEHANFQSYTPTLISAPIALWLAIQQRIETHLISISQSVFHYSSRAPPHS